MRLLAFQVPAATAAALLALAGAEGATAAPSPARTPCPAASLVGAALGQKDRAAGSQSSAYAKICLYKGGGIVPTRIQYQADTASTFAAGEKAAATGSVVKLTGLGKSAYGTKSGGFIAVFTGSESIRVTAPLVSLTRLERLERKLL